MKMRWPWVVCILIGAFAITALLIEMRSQHPPQYAGKPLSFWLDQLDTPKPEAALRAVRAIGPEAVPFLFTTVRQESAVSQRLYGPVWRVLPKSLTQYLPIPRSEGMGRTRVVTAFSVLGPGILPALIGALNDPDPNIRLVAIGGITAMGPGVGSAVPALITALNDSNVEVRFAAALALGNAGPESVQAVPALTAALNDNGFGLRKATSNSVRVSEIAAQVLGKMGPQAYIAVPGLRRMLAAADARTRQSAMLALWSIEQDTNLVVRAAEEVGRASDALTCKRFLDVLRLMGPAAQPALPAISQALTNSSLLANPSMADLSQAARATLQAIQNPTQGD